MKKMDVKNFKHHLQIANYSNIWLTPEETACIESSLIVLQSQNKLERIFFWGKINGLEADYYVAFGFKGDCFRNQKFFFSTNALDWMLLPRPHKDLLNSHQIYSNYFTGDAGLQIEPQAFQLQSDKVKLNHETTKFKEVQRLACTIHRITEESAIVPRGALYSSTEDTISLNPMFYGLKQEEAKLLSNYQYFREPKNKFNYNLMKRSQFNYSIDFLDTMDDLLPLTNSVAINFERNKDIVLLKSLHWPGMCCYHEMESGTFGFYYIGSGQKNLDILFGM